ESLRPTLGRLSVVLDKMTGTTEERMAQLVTSISDTFRTNLTDSARDEFQGLARAVGETSRALEASTRGNGQLQDNLRDLLKELEAGRARQEEASQAQQRALQSVVTEMTTTVRNLTRDANSDLKATVEQVLARSAAFGNDTSAGLAAALQRQTEAFEERTT